MSGTPGLNRPITVEDLRRKAHSIEELAKEDVRDLAEQQGTQLLVAGIVAVAVLVSVAYFAGSAAGRRRARGAARRAAVRAAQRAAAEQAAAAIARI